MIAHLSGTLLSKEPNQVIVDVGGVGYDVTIPLSTFYDLDDEKSKIELLIYTYVKEDALQLYGFKTPSERKLFIHFISVSGIGPKLGIALLSHGKTDDLKQFSATYTDSRDRKKNCRTTRRRSARQNDSVVASPGR
jgi:Holliday junction DNA helicase RuvA